MQTINTFNFCTIAQLDAIRVTECWLQVMDTVFNPHNYVLALPTHVHDPAYCVSVLHVDPKVYFAEVERFLVITETVLKTGRDINKPSPQQIDCLKALTNLFGYSTDRVRTRLRVGTLTGMLETCGVAVDGGVEPDVCLSEPETEDGDGAAHTESMPATQGTHTNELILCVK